MAIARLRATSSGSSRDWLRTAVRWTSRRAGSTTLPDETTVVDAGCFASVAVMNASTKADVGADVQAAVLERLAPSGLLTCFSG